MKSNLQNQIDIINRKHKLERKQLRLRSIIGTAVALAVGVSLLLPAFTLEKPTYCGKEVHVHTDECVEYILDCPVTGESGAVLTAAEYEMLPGADEDGANTEVLIATSGDYRENFPVFTKQDPADDLPATPSDYSASYTEEDDGIRVSEAADLRETAAEHVHNASCYKKVVICGQEEHEHGLECYIDKDADVEDLHDLEALFPTFEDEKAKDSYEYAGKLAEFQKGYRESVTNYMVLIDEEDNETPQGYTRYGDWAGDEYAVDWSPLFAAFTAEYAGMDIQSFNELAENPAGHEDEGRDYLVTADEWMQALRDVDPALYEESSLNSFAKGIFTVIGSMDDAAGGTDDITIDTEDAADGMDETVVEEAAGEDPIADLGGHISLVRDVENYIGLNYADYLEEDEEGNEVLSQAYYDEGHPAAPEVGELVFLDLDKDTYADHVGIITAVNLRKNRMSVMVGDIDDRVKEEKYSFDDMAVLGYVRLPETAEAIQRNIEVNGDSESEAESGDFSEIELESEADEEETAESEVELEMVHGPYINGTLSYGPEEAEAAGYDPAAIDYEITLTLDESARIPEDAKLKVEEITEGSPEYQAYYDDALAAGDKDTEISFARFFDISFLLDGEEIEPAAPVAVEISYDNSVEIPEEGYRKAVHFTSDGDIEVLSIAGEEEAYEEEYAETEYAATEAADGSAVSAEQLSGLEESPVLEVADSIKDRKSYTQEYNPSDFNKDEAFAAAREHEDELGIIGGVKKLGRGLRKLFIKDTHDLESEMGIEDQTVKENADEIEEAAASNDISSDASAITVKKTENVKDAADSAASGQHTESFRKASEKPDRSKAPKKTDRNTFSFVQGSFSVTGTVVYTVDFAFEVDGQVYRFSIPGGGFASLERLVEELGIIGDTGNGINGDDNRAEAAENIEENDPNAGADESGVLSDTNTALAQGDAEVSDAVKKYVSDVASVEFSSPELVDVSKAEIDTTVGSIKEVRGLEVEYSAELTKEEIAEINAQTVEAGDWALISLQPFTSEETLTITLKNGDQLVVRVTDAQISKTFITAEGDTYRVTVEYDESAGIPNGAELEVREIRDEKTCEELSKRAQSLLNAPSFSFLRIFDIDIVSEGEKVKPASDVQVMIEYIDGNQPAEGSGLSIVHFAEKGPEILSASTDINEKGVMEVSFYTESFSPFATISERINNSDISDSVIAFFNFDEVNEQHGFTSSVNGITSYALPVADGAVPDLSPAYDGNVLKLSNSNDDALSVTKADGSSLMSGLTTATISYWEYTTNDNAASWAYYAAPNGNPQVYPREYYIGALHKEGNLTAERYYNGRGNGNYAVSGAASGGAWHYVTVVYGTDTTTVYVDGEPKGQKNGQPALNDILQGESVFQIGKANWGQGEFFTGYLDEMMVMNRALTQEEVASLYNSGYAQSVSPQKQNKIDITALINYAIANGTDTVTGEETPVPAGSYRTTLPGKVLKDVIFYATEYNNGEYNYDYYAVTHDCGLAKVTDLGSEILWKDPRDIKWDLIVYTNTVPVEGGAARVVPTGYYELVYTDADKKTHYLAPQLNTSSLVQDNPLGLQFAGVSAGSYGTTIEAWDADDIEYAGIQIRHEGLIAVTGQGAEEFFFARNTEPVSYDNPRPVVTVDSAAKGIQISLFDYNGGLDGQRPTWMKELIGDGVYRSGHQVTLDLVKHNLKDGVPVASLTNEPLTELFGGSTEHVDAIYNNINHLFLQGTYDETGYFSYNSAQNYAYYNNNDKRFIVYDQAAAPTGTGSANYHGNFFPFNTFGEASNAQYMWYDVNDTLLTPDDPEYGTALRSLSNIDYSFGMEMESDFYMTKTGHDERGRDIVYEFNGDDDLWVFVDDKLALDIGGVHGAIHGTINFTTGEIIVASENLYSVTGETSTIGTTVAGSIRTTLAEQFRKAYKEQGKSDEEITAILDSTFNKDGGGKYTSFKPYTTHNLKMFYMESGKGASNLNIRFNLPVIPPASFAIEKDLPETVQSDYTDRRFAFKVYVQEAYDSEDYVLITQDQIGEGKLIVSAVYEKTTTPATFDDGILYLRPGEAIQLTVSDERLKYYVEEVQIDPDMWNHVEINHTPVQIVDDSTNPGLGHVTSDTQAVNQRTRVVFDNGPKNIQKLLINKIVESGDPESVDPTLAYEFYVYLEGHSGNLEPYSVGNYFLTKVIDGEKHYFNNLYTDLGISPQTCSRSGQYGSIGNIRAGYTIEIPGLLPGTDFYVVEREDRNPGGFMFIRKTLTDGSYDVADNEIYLIQNGNSIAPDGKITAGADAEVTIVNGDMTVNILKVDATDMSTTLSKARFRLKKLDPEGYGTYPSSESEKFEKVSEYTGTDGKTQIAGIRNGYYEISEIGVPDGYILTDDGKLYIKVWNKSITLLAKDTSKKVKEWPERKLTEQDKIRFDSETNTITVGNTRGAALPSTGGTGTGLIYFLGVMLTVLAGAGLMMKRRWKNAA